MNSQKVTLILVISFLLIPLFFIPENTEARRGCCSWHGGVCGCRCCDGTPLSSKCAPYYPSCYKSTNTVAPTVTPGIQKVETVKDSCTEEFIGSTFCKDGAIYQKQKLEDCSIINDFIIQCPEDYICKDGWCEEIEYCGDEICQNDENLFSCSVDCPKSMYCGNTVCESFETKYNCPKDCGKPEYCGDGTCQENEKCTTCPKDCGLCKYEFSNESKIKNDIQNIPTGEIVAKEQKNNPFVGIYLVIKEILSWFNIII